MWFPSEIWENIKDYIGLWDKAKKEVIKTIPIPTREFVLMSSATKALKFKKEFYRTSFFIPPLNRFIVVYSIRD